MPTSPLLLTELLTKAYLSTKTVQRANYSTTGLLPPKETITTKVQFMSTSALVGHSSFHPYGKLRELQVIVRVKYPVRAVRVKYPRSVEEIESGPGQVQTQMN